MKSNSESIINEYTLKIEEKEFFEERNFILTSESIDRLSKIYFWIKSGIPVLLEGPTGTSKTLSAEIICDYLKKEKIRFNLSSEITISDLLGKYIGNNKSWAGIKLKDNLLLMLIKKENI